MVDNCNEFQLVEGESSCASIALANGISLADFLQW